MTKDPHSGQHASGAYHPSAARQDPELTRGGRPAVPARPDLSALRIEQANKRAKLTELGRDYDDDVITRDEWLARRGRLNDRPAEQVWAGLDNAQRRAVIAAVCTVTVHPAGRGRRGFDPGTVVIEPR